MSSGVAINLMGGLTKLHTHSLASEPGSLVVRWLVKIIVHELIVETTMTTKA